MKLFGIALVFLASAGYALALGPVVPEIDANTAAAGVALVTGGILIARSRRRK